MLQMIRDCLLIFFNVQSFYLFSLVLIYSLCIYLFFMESWRTHRNIVNINFFFFYKNLCSFSFFIFYMFYILAKPVYKCDLSDHILCSVRACVCGWVGGCAHACTHACVRVHNDGRLKSASLFVSSTDSLACTFCLCPLPVITHCVTPSLHPVSGYMVR